jgi:ATP-dependent RNA helicase DHX37/DHR1
MPKFVPRQRKHKAVARQKAGPNHAPEDANSAEILPADQQERKDRKEALKADLLREAQGKISGKKKKRLDKYIVRCIQHYKGT